MDGSEVNLAVHWDSLAPETKSIKRMGREKNV